MLTLLSECHFWTFGEVSIKSTDFGAFRYLRNRELQQCNDISVQAKIEYTEQRNGIAVLKNSKKGAQRRLKDNLKKLEELLKVHKIVHTQWRDAAQLILLLANGIIVHICVDIFTGDILRMVYEKYFVGKLAAEVITDAFFTRSHIVLAYNTNQVTVVHLQKPNQQLQRPEKIANMDPRIFHVIIPGPAERKLSRRLIVNSSFDLFVVWTKSSQNEVYPWRPTLREADRANIHIFKLKDTQLESIAYCWSEHDPLCIDFLRSSESQILVVEEKISRKGEISAEICSYEITTGRMQRNAVSSISMGSQICCFEFSPDQEKLFLGAIDRKICLHDLTQQTTKFVTKADIIPNYCTWHCDSSIIMIANDRSQIQSFDLALTPIANQLQSEDVTPLNLLDLSHYFTSQPTLLSIVFSQKPDLNNFSQSYAQTDCFLFLYYENGPIGVLRFFAGAGMRGDIHNSGLTADVIIDKYLAINQIEKSVNLLQSLNWETYGAMCLISLHKIANYVFYRSEARAGRVELLAKALKTFTDELSTETKDEFSDQVFDIKRRFFFFLLRNNMYVDAFEIALDIDDYDLFMDLYNITKSKIDLIEFSAAAFSQAAAILNEEERANGTHVSMQCDVRSESALSQFSTSTDTATTLQRSQHQKNQQALKNYVPPLPSLKSKIFNAEMIKINIPKPELRIANEAVFQQVQRNQQLSVSASTTSNGDFNFVSTSVGTAQITSSSVISTLAALSSKSGNTNMIENQVQNKGMKFEVPSIMPSDGNSIQTAPILDQTIGIPTTQSVTSSVPSAQTNPNAFTQNPRSLPPKPNQISTHVPLVHYASPAVISEHSLIASPQKNFQLLPSQTYAYQPKYYQHPLVSGTIPPTSSTLISSNQVQSYQQKPAALLAKKPTASILSNTTHTNLANSNSGSVPNNTNSTNNALKEPGSSNKNAISGEKNKVKFSDTVQVAVVPDIKRKEKPMPPKRNGYSRPLQRNQFTNPRKELADSLPLCHPQDDYLKDFNPLSTDTSMRPPQSRSQSERKTTPKTNATTTPSIKVVHFGVV